MNGKSTSLNPQFLLRGSLPSLSHIVFDFDGVFTDNLVRVDSNGNESVTCSRSDSLGVSMLRRTIDERKLSCSLLVVSTETNPVVEQRCRKLSLQSVSGVIDKKKYIEDFVLDRSKNKTSGRLLYLGNDLNDLAAMKYADLSAAPKDAHPDVLKFATYVSEFEGGKGFVRDVIEQITSGISGQ